MTNLILLVLQQEMRTLSAEIRRLKAEVEDTTTKNRAVTALAASVPLIVSLLLSISLPSGCFFNVLIF
jgi:hypothetical protein